MYAVTSTPLERRTRATFRNAENKLRDALKPVIARHRTTMHAGVRALLGEIPAQQRDADTPTQ